jgi:hypothetical protein
MSETTVASKFQHIELASARPSWFLLLFLVVAWAAASACSNTCPSGFDPGEGGNCLQRIPTDPDAPYDPCDEEPPQLPPLALLPHPGSVQFQDTESMETFCDSYNAVEGHLQIGGTEAPGEQSTGIANGIVDLSPLSCLEGVGQYLFIGHNADLLSIELPNLRYVASGGTSIGMNPALKSIELPELLWGGGDISIQNNAALEHLDIPKLGWVNNNIYVTGNESLPNDQADSVWASMCTDWVTGSIFTGGNAP